MKLLSEDELTTKQALHLIDLQLREQVSFQDVHELYMLDYITSIPSPHLRTCQLLVGLNTAARLVQILKGTAGSGANTALCLFPVAFALCLLPLPHHGWPRSQARCITAFLITPPALQATCRERLCLVDLASSMRKLPSQGYFWPSYATKPPVLREALQLPAKLPHNCSMFVMPSDRNADHVL